MKKLLTSLIMCFAFSASIYAAEISIQSAKENEEGCVDIECSITDKEIFQPITVMAYKYNEDSTDNLPDKKSELLYIDQIVPEFTAVTEESANEDEYMSKDKFSVQFTPNWDYSNYQEEVYYVKIGGYNVERAESLIIMYINDGAHILGDINRDGVVDEKDVAIAVKYLSGARKLNEREFMAADVDSNGVVDINDAMMILSTNE